MMINKSLRLEICRLLWPKEYADAELDDTFTATWNEPDDNDIVDAVRGLIECRDRFATFTDFVTSRTHALKSDVDDIVEAYSDNDGLLQNIGAKR